MYAEQIEAPAAPTQPTDASASQPDALASYRPETPFLIDPAYLLAQDEAFGSADNVRDAVRDAVGEDYGYETPFLSEYELVGAEVESYDIALHREIMEEVFDEEFEDAIQELVDDVRGQFETQFGGELEHHSADAERQMGAYLVPLEEAVVAGIDKMIEGILPIDTEALNEIQLDDFLENFEFHTELDHVPFENFFGKIFKKIKKVAKKVIKVAKKFSPIHIILGKLKKLVRPLLKRVLKFALNKVPARFRPLAKRLARRFFKGALGELDDGAIDGEYLSLEDAIDQAELLGTDTEATAPSAEVIGVEFDALIAGYIMEGEDFEFTPEFSAYMNEEQFEDGGAADDLDRARDKFIRQIGSVESDEAALAEIEQFIPAILAGLKIGIKIIGRRRVVNFLAKLVAKLIRRFVGRKAAIPLSRALVDAGLSLVSLENPEEAAYEAGAVIATTVEETIDRFVTDAPPEAMEDEELMEVYVQEAFEKAVARNFPPRLVRKDLRHSISSTGTWVARPPGRRRKRYKRFTQRFDVTITPEMAKRIRSFGGQTLHSFFKEQLGLPIDRQSIKARMHLFEGIRGTSLSDISHLETRIEGLGSRSRSAWTKIHPLTREAASLLIPKHVGLARRTHRRFLSKRTRVGFGQRFYYLEVPGARTLRAPVKPAGKIGSRKTIRPVAAKASEVNVTIDFKVREIRIYDFLSEAAATEIAQGLRSGKPRSAIVKAINTSLSSALRAALSGSPGDHLKIKRETPAPEAFVAGIGPILRFVGRVVSRKLQNFVVKQLMRELKSSADRFARDFSKAADSNEDGVTLVFTLSQVGEVFDVLTGNALKRVQALSRLRSSGISGAMKIAVRAGFQRR